MSKIKRFFSTSMVYLVGNVLSKLVVFFLLPLYTSRIPPDEYGVYDLIMTLITLLAPIAFFQIWDGMFRMGFDYSEKKDKYAVTSNAGVVFGVGIVVYIAIFTVLYFIFRFENAVYILLYGLFLSLNYFYGYVCRVFLANAFFAISGLLNTVVNTVLNVILIICFDWGVESLYLSPIVGFFVQCLITECKFKVLFNFKKSAINRNIIKVMLKFSIPLCIVGASYWLLSGFTKVLIKAMIGDTANGLFGIANKFASMITLVVTIFQYAWNELAYMMANDDDRVDSYNLCIDLLLKFSILGSAGMCIFIKILFPYLIDEQYAMAIYIIPATIIGTMMNSMASFVATLFMTEKKTGTIVYSILASSAINIALGIVLTKFFGLQGATISLAVAFTMLLVLRLIQARKKIKIKINLLNTAILAVVLALAVVEFYLVKYLVVDILAVVAILGVFFVSIRKYLKLIFVKKNSNIKEDVK